MPKYTAWVPVWASAKYELQTEEVLSDEELAERFPDKARNVGHNLCWHCSEEFEINDAGNGRFEDFDVESIEVED